MLEVVLPEALNRFAQARPKVRIEAFVATSSALREIVTRTLERAGMPWRYVFTSSSLAARSRWLWQPRFGASGLIRFSVFLQRPLQPLPIPVVLGCWAPARSSWP